MLFFFWHAKKKIFFQNKNYNMDCYTSKTDSNKKIILHILNTLLKLLALWSKRKQWPVDAIFRIDFRT